MAYFEAFSGAFHRAQTLKSARRQNLKEYNYHQTCIIILDKKKIRQIKNSPRVSNKKLFNRC